MHASEKLSLEQIRQLVAASEGLRFESENRRQMYGWVESVLIEHQFKHQGVDLDPWRRKLLEPNPQS